MSSIEISLGPTTTAAGAAIGSVGKLWSDGADNSAFAAILAALGAAGTASEVAAKTAFLVGMGVVDPNSAEADLVHQDHRDEQPAAAEMGALISAAATGTDDADLSSPASTGWAATATLPQPGAFATSTGELAPTTQPSGPPQPQPPLTTAAVSSTTAGPLAPAEAELPVDLALSRQHVATPRGSGTSSVPLAAATATLAAPQPPTAGASGTGVTASTAPAAAAIPGNTSPTPGIGVAGLTAEVARLLDEPTTVLGPLHVDSASAARGPLLPSGPGFSAFTAAALASQAALSAAAADAEVAMAQVEHPEAGPQPGQPSHTLPAAANPGEADADGLTTLASTGPTAPATTAAAGLPAGLPSLTGVTPTALFTHITQLVARGDGVHRISVTLAPEALGEVQVILQARGGEVEVELIARTAQGHALLADGSSELVRLLEQIGATDSKVVVRTPEEGSASMEGHPDSQTETGDDPQHARTRAQQPAMDGTTDPPPGGKAAPASLPDSIEPVAHTRTAGVDVTV